MDALNQNQSAIEMEFVKERLAIRFERERLLRVFYPLRSILTQLIDVRVASIKLSMWLGNNRKR